MAWVLLDCDEKFRLGFIEPPGQEVPLAYYKIRVADATARAKAQSGLYMLDRDVRLSCPNPDLTAEVPAACKAGVEGECTIDQCRGRAYILATVSQYRSRIHQNRRIVAGDH